MRRGNFSYDHCHRAGHTGMKRLFLFALAALCLNAQAPSAPRRITLADAESLALQNHPRLSSDVYLARAAGELVTETRSSYYPLLSGNFTPAGGLEGSRIAAGSLNAGSIFNRLASGVTISQLITDFGRTSHLVAGSRLHAQAANQTVQATRADVLLSVNRAYFATLRSEAVLRVADQTVAERQLVADQVRLLAESKLKSGLDVSFANVNLAEAKLLLSSARNDVAAAKAELVTALGTPRDQAFEVVDESLPEIKDQNAASLLALAIRSRPDLESLRLEQASAERIAAAEGSLWLPTISAVTSVGVVPFHGAKLTDTYAAVGLNINAPILNGRLYTARRNEAEFRAQAALQRVRDLEDRVQRDVEVALLNLQTAGQRLSLTTELLNQAQRALQLAQARYDLGLSSIVELSQAQLAKTNAEIQNASARYDLQIQNVILRYQTGTLR